MIQLTNGAIVACALFMLLASVAFATWKEDAAAGAFVLFVLMFAMTLFASLPAK